MNRQEWLEERKKGIGSSDAPAILGLSKWKTALHVQQEKLSTAPHEEDNSPILKLGLLMEPVILGLYAERTGTKPQKVNRIVSHPQYPWMRASLDAKVGNPSHPLEFKHVLFAAGQFGEEGTDEIPDTYLVQTHHQITVTGAEYVEVPALIFGQLRIYRVQRNERLSEILIEREREFWEKHVLNKEPVPPDFKHPETVRLLNRMYGVADQEAITLGSEYADLAEDFQGLGEQISSLENERNEAKGRLLAAMRDAAVAHLPNGMTLVRKKVLRKAYTVSETEYTKLTIKQPKSEDLADTLSVVK